jgi:hypothetical protein
VASWQLERARSKMRRHDGAGSRRHLKPIPHRTHRYNDKRKQLPPRTPSHYPVGLSGSWIGELERIDC